MEEFDTNELFEENNEFETMKKEIEIEAAMYDLKLHLANENYDNIVRKGIDINAMKESGINMVSLEKTLNLMLDLFVELEEYEKCTKIKEVIQQI